MAKLASMVFITSGVLLLAALAAFASDTTYHDPRNPSFSLLVPDGWTAKRTDSGVSLSHGNTAVLLNAVSGSRPADDMLADVVSQFQKQAKNFHDMDKGACRFGREKGAYAVFSGISPNGTPEVTKVVTMTNGQLVYMMIEQTRPDQYEVEKGDLQRIQDSFAPEAMPTSVDDRDKLDALYAAGVINQQEYEARMKNIGGSPSASSHPATRPGNVGNSGGDSSSTSQKTAALAGTDTADRNNLSGALPTNFQRYPVVHFAIGATMNWATDNCIGWMTIGNGTIAYRAVRGTHGLHSFDIPITNIKEAKKNAFMGSALQVFHIRLKSNENYDFAVLDNAGQHVQSPAILLDAIHTAMK